MYSPIFKWKTVLEKNSIFYFDGINPLNNPT